MRIRRVKKKKIISGFFNWVLDKVFSLEGGILYFKKNLFFNIRMIFRVKIMEFL